MFGNANRIISGNFNATTLKHVENFDKPVSHLFIFDNIFAQNLDIDAVTVTSSENFVSLH